MYFRSLVKDLVVLVLLVFLVRGSVIEAYKIPSESMVPTLLVNDYILVSKLSYGFRLPGVKKALFQWSSPSRFDVVVFTREDDLKTESDEGADNIIKRVIGLPGETIEVRNMKVYIDGKELDDQKYAVWQDQGVPSGNFGPLEIPKDAVFVLGDNRDRSKDSRFWSGTNFLPISNIMGRAQLIYLSTSHFSRIGTIIR
jgi:signal peptidase I